VGKFEQVIFCTPKKLPAPTPTNAFCVQMTVTLAHYGRGFRDLNLNFESFLLSTVKLFFPILYFVLISV